MNQPSIIGMSDLERYEALVRQLLCKCVVGPYWLARNNCPLHPDGTSPQVILEDQRGEPNGSHLARPKDAD